MRSEGKDGKGKKQELEPPLNVGNFQAVKAFWTRFCCRKSPVVVMALSPLLFRLPLLSSLWRMR